VRGIRRGEQNNNIYTDTLYPVAARSGVEIAVAGARASRRGRGGCFSAGVTALARRAINKTSRPNTYILLLYSNARARKTAAGELAAAVIRRGDSACRCRGGGFGLKRDGKTHCRNGVAGTRAFAAENTE